MLYNANNGYIMQITAESKRRKQKKSKLIHRLSSYRSLKFVKMPKGRDLWKFRRNFGENDITQSWLGMLYNANNGRKQTRSEERRVGKECRSRWAQDE